MPAPFIGRWGDSAEGCKADSPMLNALVVRAKQSETQPEQDYTETVQSYAALRALSPRVVEVTQVDHGLGRKVTTRWTLSANGQALTLKPLRMVALGKAQHEAGGLESIATMHLIRCTDAAGGQAHG